MGCVQFVFIKMKLKKRQMEYLIRGLIVVKMEQGVFVSWCFFGMDYEMMVFYFYWDGVWIICMLIVDSINFFD